MADPLTWAIIGTSVGVAGSIAGTTTSIIGGVQNYNQQKENAKAQQSMLEYNARLERREAEAEEAEANEAARRQRAENERLQAAQRAAYGKSGAAIASGSPLAVLGDTAANLELGVQDIHRNGANSYNRRMAQSNSLLYQSRVAGNSVSRGQLWGSIGGGIANGLAGVGNSVSGGVSSYVNIKSAQTKGIIKG